MHLAPQCMGGGGLILHLKSLLVVLWFGLSSGVDYLLFWTVFCGLDCLMVWMVFWSRIPRGLRAGCGVCAQRGGIWRSACRGGGSMHRGGGLRAGGVYAQRGVYTLNLYSLRTAAHNVFTVSRILFTYLLCEHPLCIIHVFTCAACSRIVHLGSSVF